MNVYEKLSNCRLDLQKSELKKSGNNKFVGYNYFELGDFLPTINELNKKNGIISIVDFPGDQARMRIVNIEKPDDMIEFFSPLGSAALKGCHEVQNIGATETYQRRYLYITAYEIVEHDALDSAEPVDEAEVLLNKIKAYKSVTGLSSEQKDYIESIKKSDGVIKLQGTLRRIQDSLKEKPNEQKSAEYAIEQNKELL